jgi:hypothetical protein
VAEKSGFNIFYPKPIFQSKIPRKHFTSRDKHIHGLKKTKNITLKIKINAKPKIKPNSDLLFQGLSR